MSVSNLDESSVLLGADDVPAQKRKRNQTAPISPPTETMKAVGSEELFFNTAPATTLIAFDLHHVIARPVYGTMMRTVFGFHTWSEKARIVPYLLHPVFLYILLKESRQIPDRIMRSLIRRFPRLHQLRMADWMMAVSNCQIMDQDTMDLVMRLKARGYRIALASNISTQYFTDLRLSWRRQNEYLDTHNLLQQALLHSSTRPQIKVGHSSVEPDQHAIVLQSVSTVRGSPRLASATANTHNHHSSSDDSNPDLVRVDDDDDDNDNASPSSPRTTANASVDSSNHHNQHDTDEQEQQQQQQEQGQEQHQHHQAIDAFDVFDLVFTSDEIDNFARKPSANFFERFKTVIPSLTRPQIERVVFIDDTHDNITAATDAGFIGIHYVSAQEVAQRMHDLHML
jgi:FMN phosphatase YigB (HAD superfamily)